MIEVTFNGVNLTKYITVLEGFTIFGGADFDPKYTENAFLDGAVFNYTHKKHKVIDIPFYVDFGGAGGYDVLQRTLNVSEPKVLTISTYPNRYFYAIPSGKIDFKEYRLNGTGTLHFIVPSGVARSMQTKTFTFTKNSDGVLETEIINDGTESVPVTYDITLKKESGFIGIVSPYGAMEFGKRDEIDGYMDKKNVTLVENKRGDFSNWTNGTVNYENPAKKVVTHLSASGEKYGYLGDLTTPFNTSGEASAMQYGGLREHELSEAVANWYIWGRAWFEAGLMGQTGAWCLSVIDEQNHLIAGMAIEKQDRIGNTAEIRFLVGDGKGGSVAINDPIQFDACKAFPNNPYGEDALEPNKNANMFDLKKEGNKLTFYYFGRYYNYYGERFKSQKAKKIQFFNGQYANRNSGGQMVTRKALNYFRFEKLNVEFWRDVPNRFRSGAVIKITGNDGIFYVDNQRKFSEEVIGTVYFKVPPGRTKVQLLTSTFAEVENAKATIRELYI